MAFATWIGGKNLDPLWILKICNVSPDFYFSTGPFLGPFGEIDDQPVRAVMDVPASLPTQKISYKGGGVCVGTMNLSIMDIYVSGLAPRSILYKKNFIGKPMELWLGSASETTFDDTAFLRVFSGLLKDIQYQDGKWVLECEDYLSKAKTTPIKLEESWLAVCDDGSGNGYGPKDEYMLVKRRKKTPPITVPTNLSTNGSFASSVAGWAVDGGTITYNSGAGHGGVAGYAKLKSSTADGVMTATQTVVIPQSKKGTTYCVMVYSSRDSASTVTDTKYQLRVQVETRRSTGPPLDVAFGTARKIRSSNDGWGLHSTCITVANPNATRLTVKICTATGTTYSAWIDDVRVYEIPPAQFLGMKREIYGVVGIDESVTPNRLTVVHAALGTRENQQAIETKGKFVKFFAGRAWNVILQILTTTATGGNGDWDRGDGFGCGIPYGYIDVNSFAAVAESSADHYNVAAICVEDIQDPIDFIDKEILQPFGWSLTIGPTGLIQLGRLPAYPVAASLGSFTDAGMADVRPSIRSAPADAITEITLAVDYDFFNAVETGSDNDPWAKKAKGVILNRARTDDANYVGRWTLDEFDHRSDYVMMDAARTNKGIYGTRSHAIKSKAIRTFKSASQGMACPIIYDTGAEAPYYHQHWKGDYFLRETAKKLFSFYSCPPTYIKANALAPASQFTVGGVYTVNFASLPNMKQLGGGYLGTGDIYAMLISKQIQPKTLTVATEWVVVDSAWVSPPVSAPGSVVAATAPSVAAVHSAGKNIVVDIVNLAGLNSGNFEFIPKGAFLGAKITHWYGDVDNAIPTTAGYQYTECLVSWQNVNDPNRVFIPIARFNTSRFILVLPGSGFIKADKENCYEEFTLRFRWRYNNGTYSTTSDITLSPGASGWTPITIPTTND